MLTLRGVSKSFGTGRARSTVLNDINLDVAPGEFLAIVGYSGSGKSTLINLMAGLLTADAGEVLKAGVPITGPGPDRGVVFQSYSLMPWLSVTDNVALAVDAVFSKLSTAERRERVRHYVEMVGLTPARDKRPAELSGGMRQRVAFARALAAAPDILLLDEPLSALDALTRAKLQDELTRLWTQEQKTVVMITNDVDEGLLLADRIIPLTPGPSATLGSIFKVDLPRPRDRQACNRAPRFQELRREITAYLLEAGRIHASTGREVGPPPSIRPTTARELQPIGTTHHGAATSGMCRAVRPCLGRARHPHPRVTSRTRVRSHRHPRKGISPARLARLCHAAAPWNSRVVSRLGIPSIREHRLGLRRQ